MCIRDRTNAFLTTFECLVRGTASVDSVRDAVTRTDWNYDNCQLLDEARQGRHFYSNFGSREGSGTTLYEAFIIAKSNNDITLLDGTRTTTGDRIGYRRSLTWENTNLLLIEGNVTTMITELDLASEKRTGRSTESFSQFFVQQPDGSFEPASCLLYTSPSPRDATLSRMPSSA